MWSNIDICAEKRVRPGQLTRQKRPSREISVHFARHWGLPHCFYRRGRSRLPRGRAPAARAISSARLNSASPTPPPATPAAPRPNRSRAPRPWLDLLYVDVLVRRFEAATGNRAVLVETGETFEALATQGAGTGVGLRPAPAVADVADEPPRNGRLLPVKRVGACTAEVRGSNPLSSTSHTLDRAHFPDSVISADFAQRYRRRRGASL